MEINLSSVQFLCQLMLWMVVGVFASCSDPRTSIVRECVVESTAKQDRVCILKVAKRESADTTSFSFKEILWEKGVEGKWIPYKRIDKETIVKTEPLFLTIKDIHSFEPANGSVVWLLRLKVPFSDGAGFVVKEVWSEWSLDPLQPLRTAISNPGNRNIE